MPDAHQGYGMAIGGVAAFDVDKGVISPGGVGYDINCSVRLLRTNLVLSDIEKIGNPKKLEIFGNSKTKSFSVKELIHSLFRTIPSGVGRGSKMNLSKKDLDDVLTKGAQWVVEKGYGTKEDYLHTEENGRLEGNPEDVSKRAKDRGIGQLGTLGAGNHFIELQIVEKVFDSAIAEVFGLKEGMITIMIHCGSRGLGHQVASDYIRLMENEYGFPEQDRELVNAPIKSEFGKKYLSAMNCAANFAFANKQLITHWVRQNLKHYFPDTQKSKIFGSTKSKDFEGIKIDVVYDICHNIAKFEKHNINGEEKEVLVMRKGATRSFGPNRKEVPEDYRKVGQPVLIPGTMGTASYVLVGTSKAEEVSFGSTAHGAGRVQSRTKARKEIRAEGVKEKLSKKGIELEAGSYKSISEESPQAYKDIDEVVEVSHKAGIGNLVAKLKPIGVMKG